jgi:hypothetical protein
LGVAKDAVQAYAWLQLHLDTASPSFLPSARRAELNRIALGVDVATSQEGKRLAALYRSGRCPELVVLARPAPKPALAASAQKSPAKPAPSATPQPAPALKLNGIAMGPNPVAMINGKTVGVGESATIATKTGTYVLKCLKIDSDSVLVNVEGEAEPRQIRFR